MATNRFEPLYDTVIVERVESTSQTPGGIFIPDSGKDKPQEAVVIAVGPGTVQFGQRVPLDVVPGDNVLFGKYLGSEVVLDGSTYLILRENEIYTKVKTR